ncbi:MAG: Antitoxin HigA [Bacteroidota bacterium]|jgi:HTH-type transcriptional regulator/antitoxin HigA
MIGPEFLSTFRLKPIKTIGDWENARSWKVSFESEVYRRKHLAAAAGEESQLSVGEFQLSEGELQLADGEFQLSDGESQLSDGESQLFDGHFPLPEGEIPMDPILLEVTPVDSIKGDPIPVEEYSVDEMSGSQGPLQFRSGSDKNLIEFPERLTLELTLSEVVDLLGVLTDHFDRHFWYDESGDVIDEIRSRMQRQEFRNRDLVEEIGSKGYVSDILNRRKPLTLRTARVFKHFFNIPAEWLITGYKLDPREVDDFKFSSRSKVGKIPNKKAMPNGGVSNPIRKKNSQQSKSDAKKLVFEKVFRFS